MAPPPSSKQDEFTGKDAKMFFELLRDCPVPVKLYVGAYCQRTGQSPKTVLKRLSELKRHSGLNVVGSNTAPSGNGEVAVAMPRASSTRVAGDGKDDEEPKPKIKRERVATKAAIAKAKVPEPESGKNMKVEGKDDIGFAAAIGLPSPATSSATPPVDNPNNNKSGFGMQKTMATTTSTGLPGAQMHLYMPMKRSLAEYEGGQSDVDGGAIKKAKTESWSFY